MASPSSAQSAAAVDNAPPPCAAQQLPEQLWQLSAIKAVAALRDGLVTPLQLVEAAERRWQQTDHIINAMPVTCWEQAKAEARRMMAARGQLAHGAAGMTDDQVNHDAPAAAVAVAAGRCTDDNKSGDANQHGLPGALADGRGEDDIYLYGLPVAVKDLHAVAGLPFTYGSLVYKGRVAQEDDPLVARLRARGAVIVGKTNTPEWGAGSQTYNSVFGTTVNPFDARLTAGGSSGGSAAAVAAGQCWHTAWATKRARPRTPAQRNYTPNC